VSATFHQHDPDDDTADLGPPISFADALDDEPGASDAKPSRQRPTSRLRRVHGLAIFCCYLVTLASAAWLLVEALLHLQALVMVLAVATLVWLGPDTRRMYRWLRTDTGEALPAWWVAQLVACVITALDLFLLVYALL